MSRSPEFLRWVAPLFLAAALTPLPASAQGVTPSVSAKFEVARTAVFQGETFDLTLTVTAVGVSLGQSIQLSELASPADLSVSAFHELPPERTEAQGASRETHRYRCSARALRTGSVTIGPTLRVGVMTVRNSLFGRTMMESIQTLAVEPLRLEVRPLPEEGRPADFSGAIGSFNFEAAVSPTDVAVGDLVTVGLRVNGKGSLDRVSPPRVPPTPLFRMYDPVPAGTKTERAVAYEQTLVPLSTNSLQIPAVTFTFFDPQAAAYRSISRGPFALTFHPPATEKFEPYRPPDFPSAAAAQPSAPGPAAKPDEGVPGRVVAIGLYLFAAVVVVEAARRLKRRGRVAAVAAGLVAAAAFLPYRGFVHAHVGRARGLPVAAAVTARFAPSPAASPLFDVPAGGLVRVVERSGEWVRVDFEARQGWIPAAKLATDPRAGAAAAPP